MTSEMLCNYTWLLQPPETRARPFLLQSQTWCVTSCKTVCLFFWEPYVIISGFFFWRTPDNLLFIAFFPYLVITVYYFIHSSSRKEDFSMKLFTFPVFLLSVKLCNFIHPPGLRTIPLSKINPSPVIWDWHSSPSLTEILLHQIYSPPALLSSVCPPYIPSLIPLWGQKRTKPFLILHIFHMYQSLGF